MNQNRFFNYKNDMVCRSSEVMQLKTLLTHSLLCQDLFNCFYFLLSNWAGQLHLDTQIH